eukprot:gene8230-55_t
MKLTCLEPKIEPAPPAFPSVNLFNDHYHNYKFMPQSFRASFKSNHFASPLYTPLKDNNSILKRFENTQNLKENNSKTKTNTAIQKPQHLMKSKKQSQFNNGHWSTEEHENFLKGFKACGRQWAQIAKEYVKTRSRIQVISHAQQFIK